jgi:FkbM family methyltransferase
MSALKQIGYRAAVLKCAIAYNFRCHRVGLPPFTWLTKVPLRKHGRSVYLRGGTSDYDIFKQIFVEDEYAPLGQLSNPRCIVDCGANVGFSSLYFATIYPSARILAIEPDGQNASVFRRNLSDYEDRVELIQSAVWGHPARLVLQRAPVTMEAAIHVREAAEGEQEDFVAIDIPAILDRLQSESVDLLKVDIEGSEGELFREPYCHRWLPRVKNIAIELHNDTCRAAFFRAMERYNCDLSESGELTICKNLTPKSVLHPVA